MEELINKLVLIVDDNPHNIQVLAAVINQCGYESGFAMNGKEALDFLEENIPTLILLDVMMPDMNGYEVCTKIKEQKHLQDIPVIFLTAKSEKEDIIRGFEVGGVDYVTKPFNNMELKMRIRNHIDLMSSKSQLIALNKELKTLNATKDKFFSIIAHDLRGPIGGMNQYIELVMDEAESIGNQTLIEDLKILKDLSKSSYELLENLLIWASSQKGIIDFSPKLSNLYNLVESNIELFKQSVKKKNITLKNELNKDLEVIFDYNMINAVVRNLINNAIKYTNRDGEIIISSNHTNKFIEIIVSDNGVGMSESISENLFRIDVQRYSKDGTDGEIGSGLGLILCKEFIDKHKGEISVTSQIGKGSTFRFSIPL